MNNKIEIVLLSAITIFIGLAVLSGCSDDNFRMQKYDSTAQATPNSAIVVIGTKNLTCIDFDKFSKEKVLAANDKTTTQIQTSETSANQANEVAATSEPKSHAKQETNKLVSADPNNQEYPKPKLSELFKISSPKNNQEQISETDKPVKITKIQRTKVTPNQTTYRVLKANRLFTYGYANSIYTIEPGTYYISYAYSDDNNVERHLQLPGITSDNQITYGAFTVKAGEVLYLGDIGIDWFVKDPAQMIKVGGDLQLVKQELIDANQPELAAKLRRATFVRPGSNLED